jgi:pSer/pThr/pTyr-binding forkhead associated (FHA) protein
MDPVTWLEVLDRRQNVVERRRLDGTALTVGRGYASDVVVDDPQICPLHVRISAGPDGGLEVEDLSSVNGVWTGDGQRVMRALVGSGSTLSIGRTTLRFFGPGHAVAATERADEPDPAWQRWALDPRVTALLAAGALVAISVQSLLGDYSRIRASKALSDSVMVLLAIAIYAGLWAVLSRAMVHRFHFRPHLAVASAALLALAGCSIGTGYAQFFFPASDAVPLLSASAFVVVGVLAVYGHLAFATSLRARRRAVTAGLISGAVVALAVVSALAEDDYSSTPEFSATVRGIGAAALPRSEVEELTAGAAELRREVDALADRKPAGR